MLNVSSEIRPVLFNGVFIGVLIAIFARGKIGRWHPRGRTRFRRLTERGDETLAELRLEWIHWRGQAQGPGRVWARVFEWWRHQSLSTCAKALGGKGQESHLQADPPSHFVGTESS